MEHKNSAIFFAVLFSLSLIIATCLPHSAAAAAASTNSSTLSFPAVFAFGDSTIDSGNNNGLATIFRCDHPPYGRNFPGHAATGRFSNGLLATDFLVAKLGIKPLLPAYRDLTLSDGDLLTGASFASGGSGLDDATTALTGVLNMEAQLRDFDAAVRRMERAVGRNRTQELLGESVFVISVGTNDIVFNLYTTLSFQHTASSYQDFLLVRLQSFIQSLYERGARKFGVAGLPPVGCLPLQVTVGSVLPSAHALQRLCVFQQNADAQAYNAKLQKLIIPTLTASLHGSKIVYFDIFDSMMDMVIHPTKYGFQQTLEGCCGTGLAELGPLCVNGFLMCPDASRRIFWDSMHPTQAAYRAIADRFFQTVLNQLH